MGTWLRRLRGAIGMGLLWAVGWAFCGILIGVASILLPFLPWHYVFDVFDAPLPAAAVPGFVGGMFFSLVLSAAGRRRRFSEMSLGRFAAYGAAGGVLLTLFPFAMAAVGLATFKPGAWVPVLAMGVPLTVLSAGSAAGSLLLARVGEDGGPRVVGRGGGGDGAKQLPGGRQS